MVDTLDSSRLVDWLQRTQEDRLRLIADYDADDYELRYVRPVLEEMYDEEDWEATFENHRLVAPLGYDQANTIQAGDVRANITVFDRVIGIQYLEGESRGTIVSLDAEPGIDLIEIVATGLQLLLDDRDREDVDVDDQPAADETDQFSQWWSENQMGSL